MVGVDYSMTASVNGTVNGVAFSASERVSLGGDDGNDPYFGIGAAYRFDKNWSLKLDYLRIEVADSDVDSMLLRISYNY